MKIQGREMIKENGNTLPDEELLARIHQTDQMSDILEATDILMERYKEMVRGKARTYFLMGADRDDVIQEGMIGLYKAIMDFRPEKDVNFKKFAELCITRQIISAVRISSRLKHMPLNQAVSLESHIWDKEGKERRLADVLPGPSDLNPEKILMDEEKMQQLKQSIGNRLSSMEKNELTLFLSGMDYIQIADHLGKQPKSIDNALQRIKQKIMKILEA